MGELADKSSLSSLNQMFQTFFLSTFHIFSVNLRNKKGKILVPGITGFKKCIYKNVL